MKVAIIGPICKDINITSNEQFELTGGVTYYTGQALSFLDVDTIVFGYYDHKDPPFSRTFNFKLIPINTQGTITFKNKPNHNKRSQKAITPLNEISVKDIQRKKLKGLDYLIMGPLFNDNISASTIEDFTNIINDKTKIVLATQGMIRYLYKERIIKKNPNNVQDALPYVDYSFYDAEELKFVSGENDIFQGVKYLQNNHGAKNIIVTLGSKGSYIFLNKKKYKIKAHNPNDSVSTIGAGDSYMAGFIKAQELYDDPKKQGEFAAMTATMSIEKKGPFNNTVEDVLERL